MSVCSQTELEKLDGTRFTSKEREELKEQEHVLQCEEEDQGDREQRNEAPVGKTALTERSHKSQTGASQSHESEAHVHMTEQQECSALEDGETSKEAVRRDEVLDPSVSHRER